MNQDKYKVQLKCVRCDCVIYNNTIMVSGSQLTYKKMYMDEDIEENVYVHETWHLYQDGLIDANGVILRLKALHEDS